MQARIRFNGFTAEIQYSISRDRGATFTKPRKLTVPANRSGPSNTYVYPSVGVDGTVYVAFSSFPACCSSPATIYVTRSTDDGRTWAPFVRVASTPAVLSLPNTRFRDGITEHFAASPTYPGHAYLVYERWDGEQMDVMFTQTVDGGVTWSEPVQVNDNADPEGAPTDQFQPQVAAGPGGAVAVNFYDRRLACPADKSVVAEHAGRANFCIDVSLQAFKDDGNGAAPVGGNARISQFTWDPEQPAQKVDGLSQYPCAGHTDPCANGRGFIGDYFGLAVSELNVYSLFVSTHYASKVKADGGGPVYYQQQVLATVPRSAFGAGY